MLTKIRDSSKSLAFYVLGGIVVAVLVVSFGTPSLSTMGTVEGGAKTAVEVAGKEVSAEAFRQVFLLAGGGQVPVEAAKSQRLKELIMDRVIERELLAHEGERLGFRVGDDELQDFIARSRLMLFGREQILSSVQKDGVFDYDLFKRFLQFQGMNTRSYMDMQRRELLAARTRAVLTSGVSASLEEVKQRYQREGDQVNMEYLRFPVRRFEDAIEPTAEEVAAYLAKNEKKVKDEYEQKKFLFDKVPLERKLRQIVVGFPAAKLEQAAAPAADGTKAAPPASNPDDARAKANAKAQVDRVAAEIRGGRDIKAVFARLAARTGGKAAGPATETTRLGWRRKDATGLSAAIEAKVWAAKDGELVGPEEDSDGFRLIFVEGTRQGDLAFDVVKADLAEDLARKELAAARAREKAVQVLAVAKAASAKPWKELFPAPAEQPAGADAVGDAPQSEETGLFSRRGNVVEGIGLSAELAQAAFDLTESAPFFGPLEVAGSYVVVKLKQRQRADMAEFEKSKNDLLQGASEMKGRQVAMEWALRRCKETNDGKRIVVNRDILLYEDGKPAAVPYEPCMPPSPFGL